MVSLRDVSIAAWAYGVCGPHQPPFDEHKYRMPLDSLAELAQCISSRYCCAVNSKYFGLATQLLLWPLYWHFHEFS